MGSSPLFAALDLLFRRYNITTVNELAILLRQDGNGNGAADHLTGSNNRQAAYKKRRLGSEASPAPTTRARRRASRLDCSITSFVTSLVTSNVLVMRY